MRPVCYHSIGVLGGALVIGAGVATISYKIAEEDDKFSKQVSLLAGAFVGTLCYLSALSSLQTF